MLNNKPALEQLMLDIRDQCVKKHYLLTNQIKQFSNKMTSLFINDLVELCVQIMRGSLRRASVHRLRNLFDFS